VRGRSAWSCGGRRGARRSARREGPRRRRSSQRLPVHGVRMQAMNAAGDAQRRVLRGRLLRRPSTERRSAAAWIDRSVPLGRYCRSSPLVFSLLPRCQGLAGSARKMPPDSSDAVSCARGFRWWCYRSRTCPTCLQMRWFPALGLDPHYLSTRLRTTPMMTKLGTVCVMSPIHVLWNRRVG
jgi:hypothetical protein